MSNELDKIVAKRNKIIIILYFIITLSAIVGICINYFGLGRMPKDTYNFIFKLEFYGSQLLMYFFMFKLYKTSKIIGQNKNFRNQFNDERMILIRLKSLARGFKAMMYTFILITVVHTIISLVYNIEKIFGYPEIIIAYISVFTICFIGFTTAFVSYFTLDN